MTVYSFYIFDRTAMCIYSRKWVDNNPKSPVAAGSTPVPPDEELLTDKPVSNINPGAPTEHSSTRTAKTSSKSNIEEQNDPTGSNDEKLVFGTVYSLRNIIHKLDGNETTFISYRTGEYKLHYFETPTRIKFVMLTDPKTMNLRVALQQIWSNLYLEYVVKNPLAPIGSTGHGNIANELFDKALESFVSQVLTT